MVKRELLEEVIPWLKEKKIVLIKGARQVGKTTLLFQIKELLEREKKQVIYFSVDQELTNPIFSEPKLLLQFLKNEYDIERKDSYLLLDEFQYLKNAGLFLKVLFDMSKEFLHIIVSGSSSLRLSEDKEFLTGRKIEFILFPFSFLEYLSAKSQFKYEFKWNIQEDFRKIEEFYRIYSDDLKVNFLDYINWGGYPEVVLQSHTEKKKQILKEIINTYIRKDITQFLKVENITGFNNLISLLSSQIASLVNKHELCNTLGLHAKTLDKYLDILEGTFIVSFLKPFYTNIRKEISKMPKVYVNDFGIRRYFLNIEYNNYPLIEGKCIENFTYNILKRKFEEENLHFYRTISKSEIDFILERGNRLIIIETKFTSKGKLSYAIKRFREQYKNVEYTILITKDLIKKEKDMFYIPVIILPFVEFGV